MGNARQWGLELDTEFTRQMGDVRKFVLDVITEGLDGVKRKSPVDTGHFRNNWLVSVGGTDGDVAPFPASMVGQSLAAIQAFAATEGWPVIYIQNNLPYANRLEDGYSKQAPAGMVALTVAELQAKINGASI